jgi:hypothetical protein
MEELTGHSIGAKARRVIGDGQSVLAWKDLKVASPDKYRYLLIDPADMHAFAHAMYAGHILFWYCLLQHCARKLKRRWSTTLLAVASQLSLCF